MKNQLKTLGLTCFILIGGLGAFLSSCNKENDIKKPEKSFEQRLEEDQTFARFMSTSTEILEQYGDRIDALDETKKAELMSILQKGTSAKDGERVLEILGFTDQDKADFTKLNQEAYSQNALLNQKYPELKSMNSQEKQVLFGKMISKPSINKLIFKTSGLDATPNSRINVRCYECESRYNACAAQVAAQFVGLMATCLVLPFPANVICAAAFGIDRNIAMRQCGDQKRDCLASCTR